MSSEKTYYELLGIPSSASQEDIKSAYLRAIAYYHPDRNKSYEAVEMTKLVNLSNDTLSDPSRKNDYDSMLLAKDQLDSDNMENQQDIEEMLLSGTEKKPSKGFSFNNMLRRMIGAAMLNANVFEEIENDNQATIQAVAVVLVASFCAGIGSLSLNSVDPSVLDLVLSSFTSLIRWAFLALITYFLGSTLFKTENTNVTWGQLARTMGFAQSPAILVSFGYFSQTVFSYLTVIVTFWLIATMVIAVRQSLDYKMNLSGSLRAFVVVVLASIPGLIINYSILSISS